VLLDLPGSVYQVRRHRRGRAAELERATASEEPDRHAMAAMKEIVLARGLACGQARALDSIPVGVR
jgi:hypothetical protein